MSRARRVVFLCSGDGGNLKFLHRAIAQGFLADHVLAGVITDRPCGALNYARQESIYATEVKYSRQDGKALKDCLEQLSPDVIITNIHKILDADLVRSYTGKLINLHYSLLPAFKGLIGAEPVKQALAMGCRFVGVTTHDVSEDVDSGAIFRQAAIPVPTNPNFDSIMNTVFRAGCLVLLGTLMDKSGLSANRSEIFAAGAYFGPPLPIDPIAFNEDFWQQFRG